MNLTKLLSFAVTGFVGAAISDLDTWRRAAREDGTLPRFDFARAFPRWVMGAITGITGAFGFDSLGGA